MSTNDEFERRVAVERARLAETQEVARVGSWETDLATLTVTWSAESYRIFGTDPAHFAPSHSGFLERVHPQDRDVVDAALRASLGDSEVHTLEHRIVTPEGDEKVVEERWRVFAGEHGPGRAVGTCRDVTAQRRAEAELLASQALLRMASRLSRLGAWSIDVGAARVTWSDEVREIHEVGPEFEPTLEAVLAFYAPADQPRIREAFAACLDHGQPFDLELQLVGARGRSVRVRTLAEAVRGEDGRVIRVQGAVQDVTERHQFEQRALRSQRLESLGTLAGGIAHDLNNVLAPIPMAVEALRRHLSEPRAERWLAAIEQSASRGAGLIRQVLAFARGAEAGHRVRLDPTELARDVGRIVRETFPKDVAFELAVPAEPWSLEADPTQLHQVLVNLCVNARDAMPTGGRLVLRLANEELDAPAAARAGLEPGCYVAITVADTGQGVPLEIQDRIFEPFFTTKEVGRGTGLGLSTTYSIVRGHGGAVTLVSQPGRGATFTVHLPAAEGPALDSRAAESEPPQGSGELVLVVDDEPAIREILVETLTNSGYRVVTACDGSDALAVYDAHQLEVALVLTDISMPGLDGEALIAALRERDPRLPIVASSGLHRAEGLAAPGEVTQFLSKPYATTTLLQAVARARRRGSPDSTAPVGLRRAAGGTADP